MPKTRAQKEETVTKLKEKLGKARALVFADYRGLTMKQLSDLRDKLREQNAEFTITKNTLLERALPTNYPLRPPLAWLRSEASQLPASPASGVASQRGEPTTNYQGPTAALFAYDDEISPIKILVKALKDAALGKVKMGFLGAEPLDEMRIQQLASLPTKDELRGQTVGILVAPLQGIVSVLQGNLRNLVYALSEIKKMKGGV